MKSGAQTTVRGEHFLHKELWRVVERQEEQAAAVRTGRFYNDLAAMIFAFLTLEGYLNFVGQRLAPEDWKNERVHFAKSGFEGKLLKILELTGLTPDRQKRPFTTVYELKALRDRIVHAKTETFQRTLNHGTHRAPSLHRVPLDTIVNEKRSKIAAEDVKKFIEEIHAAAKKKFHDPWFGNKPFGGIMMHASGSTQLVPAALAV